jgi:hypothetical protein
MKVCGSEIKQIDRFAYLASMVEKNSKIQNEINERLRKASQSYHLVKSILLNKDIRQSVKP